MPDYSDARDPAMAEVSQKPSTPAPAAAQPAAGGQKHTVAKDETLSHIALKYSGHATKPYWMHIYEANKAVIGKYPNIIRKGMEGVIPDLPAELKK
jgi:nucleoid-associated protein YgaU